MKITTSLERHLRVEVVDDGHRDWAAVRRQIGRAGRPDPLRVDPAGRLSARQAVVDAFLDGRPVGHACFTVEPIPATAGRPTVAARLVSYSVDTPFVGTAVEQVLMSVAHARARTMGCGELITTPRQADQRRAA